MGTRNGSPSPVRSEGDGMTNVIAFPLARRREMRTAVVIVRARLATGDHAGAERLWRGCMRSINRLMRADGLGAVERREALDRADRDFARLVAEVAAQRGAGR